MGTHLLCSGDPHLHLTSLDHTSLSNLGFHLRPRYGLGPSFVTEKRPSPHGVLASSLQVWTQPTLEGFFLGFASTQRAWALCPPALSLPEPGSLAPWPAPSTSSLSSGHWKQLRVRSLSQCILGPECLQVSTGPENIHGLQGGVLQDSQESTWVKGSLFSILTRVTSADL